MGASIRGILDSFEKKPGPRNPRTNLLRLRKTEALKRYGDEGRMRLARAFVKAAVNHYAVGNMKLGRRFYDGAFAFGHRDAVRGALLSTCLAAARQALRKGQHDVVWRLLEISLFYCPDSLGYEGVKTIYLRYGVDTRELGAPSEGQIRFHALRSAQLLPVAA